MKTLMIFLMLLGGICQAQNYGLDDCGTWEVDKKYTTNWKTIDTLKYNSDGDTIWIYDEWKVRINFNSNLMYCPCGCLSDKYECQKRICGLGIIQERCEVTTYKYIPKPLNAFEQKVQELTEINVIPDGNWAFDSSAFLKFDSITLINDTLWAEPNVKIETLLEEQEIYRIKKRKSR